MNTMSKKHLSHLLSGIVRYRMQEQIVDALIDELIVAALSAGYKPEAEMVDYIASFAKDEMKVRENKLSAMYPDGLQAFYEGEDPEGFANEMIAKYGFDPAKDNPGWGREFKFEDGYNPTKYEFVCPAECLDEVYGGRNEYKLFMLLPNVPLGLQGYKQLC